MSMKRALIITMTAIVAMCALTIVNALARPSWGIVVDQHQQVYFSDVTISGGDLYILEVGFTPPRTYLGPRVRKLSSGGKVTVLATVGEGQKVSRGKPATGENSSTGENVEGTSVGDIVRGREGLFMCSSLRETGICALVLIIQRAREEK
jgi:hypothetical protein